MREAAIRAGRKLGLSGLALVTFVNQAMAAVPTSVSDAIATTQTDAVTVAGLMVGVTAALLVFVYIKRLMK